LFDASLLYSSSVEHTANVCRATSHEQGPGEDNCLFTSVIRLKVPWGWHRHWHVSCCLLCRICFSTHINIEATVEETNVW